MLKNKPQVYTNDQELIQLTEKIFQWIQSYTPPPGASNVYLAGRHFIEATESVTTSSTFQCTTAVDTSQQSVVTFFVINTGSESAVVKLQISPNNSIYIDDGIDITVQAGEMKALVPGIFARYTHLCYKSAGDNTTSLDIIMQGYV